MVYCQKPVLEGVGGRSDGLLRRRDVFHVLVYPCLSRAIARSAHSRRNGEPMHPPIAAPAPNPVPGSLPYYVERNLRIADFVRWASGQPPDDPPDDPPEAPPSDARLVSILGPPGIGKSAFIAQLYAALRARLPEVFALPVLALNQRQDEASLGEWLREAWDEADAQYTLGPMPNGQGVNSAIEILCNGCAANPVTVLVDAFEDAPLPWRVRIEDLFISIMGSQRARIVLSRRDEFALQRPQVRNRGLDKDLTLKGLVTAPATFDRDEAELLLRERLGHAAAASATPAYFADAWDRELDAIIAAAAFPAGAQDALVTHLRPYLTPSPYVNLLLLKHTLLHPRTAPPLTIAALRALGLAEYRRRSKVDAERLIWLCGWLRGGTSFTLENFKAAGGTTVDHEHLMTAGVVFYLERTSRYGVDPGVSGLV